MANYGVDTFFGPSLVMVFARLPAREKLHQMFQQALVEDRMLPFQFRAWKEPATLDRMSSMIEDAEGLPKIDLYVKRIPKEGEGISMRDAINLNFDGSNVLGVDRSSGRVQRFEPLGGRIVKVRVAKVAFDPLDPAHVELVLGIFKKIVQLLEPDFAAIDNWHERFAKRKDQDLRQFGWGAMYYGPNMMKTVGWQEMESCAAIIKEQWPNGGAWTQMWENPFVVSNQILRHVEKELALKERFGGSRKTAKNPAIRAAVLQRIRISSAVRSGLPLPPSLPAPELIRTIGVLALSRDGRTDGTLDSDDVQTQAGLDECRATRIDPQDKQALCSLLVRLAKSFDLRPLVRELA